jgi:hypothetical protein
LGAAEKGCLPDVAEEIQVLNEAMDAPDLFSNPSSARSDSLAAIAAECGESIANSILARVKEFPSRERLLAEIMKHGLESVPSQILWLGLEEEAAPILVVYKLIHEALSNTPSVFRGFVQRLLAAQPDRFSPVFSRETLWSVVARYPKFDVPDDLASFEYIRCMLGVVNSKGFWRRSDAELDREAENIVVMLNKHQRFKEGAEALRLMQVEQAKALTFGNLVVQVPAKLQQFANEVCELGMHGRLPTEKEIADKLHEIVRDPISEARHFGVPIDLLYSELNGDTVECLMLVRSSAGEEDQKKLRRQSLYIRYFMKLAFTAYPIEKLRVRLAFYLDPESRLNLPADDASLFYNDEQIPFTEFWKTVTGRGDGHMLVTVVRDTAAARLRRENFVQTVKKHFARESKSG